MHLHKVTSISCFVLISVVSIQLRIVSATQSHAAAFAMNMNANYERGTIYNIQGTLAYISARAFECKIDWCTLYCNNAALWYQSGFAVLKIDRATPIVNCIMPPCRYSFTVMLWCSYSSNILFRTWKQCRHFFFNVVSSKGGSSMDRSSAMRQ